MINISVGLSRITVSTFGVKENVHRKSRNIIDAFSVDSRRRMLNYLRNSEAEFKYMVTLTYPGEGSECYWVYHQAHLRAFIERMRRAGHVSDESSVFWFIEFQKRGAPHYHLYIERRIDFDWIAKNWYEVVGSGHPDHLAAGTRIEKFRCGRQGFTSYAAKYAAKLDQKVVPELFKAAKSYYAPEIELNGFRWWGIAGNRRVVVASIKLESSSRADEDKIEILKLVQMIKDSRITEKNVVFAYDHGYVLNLLDDEGKLLRVLERVLKVEIARWEKLFADISPHENKNEGSHLARSREYIALQEKMDFLNRKLSESC